MKTNPPPTALTLFIKSSSIPSFFGFAATNSKGGKLLKEYSSQTECSKDIEYDNGELSRAIKNQTLIKKQYYVSNTLVDEFIQKPRK